MLGTESPVAFDARTRKSCSTPRSRSDKEISVSVVVTCHAPQSLMLRLYNDTVPIDLQSILTKLRDIQPDLRNKYGVSGLWVFGSYVRGDQHGDSDVDVLVEFDRPGMTLIKFADLELRLGDHLGMKVDLVQRSALKKRIEPSVIAEAVAV